MPLYFKELEYAFVMWYKIYTMNKPVDCAASKVSYRKMQKSAKKKLLITVLKLLKKIEDNDMSVIPDLDGDFYIKVEPKNTELNDIQSKL